MKQRVKITANAVLWIGVGIALLAEIIFDSAGMPQKWHAAIMWTAVAFGPPTVVRRKRWMFASFWMSWTLYLGLHTVGMWILFAYVLAKVQVLGTLYVVPFAGIEAFVILILLSKGRIPPRVQPAP